MKTRGRFAITVVGLLVVAVRPVDTCADDAPTTAPAVSQQRIRDLISRIDVHNPGPGKLNYTPAVDELITIGMPSLPHVLPLMLSEEWLIRLLAETVIYNVMIREFGWVSGQGWTDKAGEAAFNKLIEELGSLSHEDDADTRRKRLKRWQEWLSERNVT